jgi:protein TonB
MIRGLAVAALSVVLLSGFQAPEGPTVAVVDASTVGWISRPSGADFAREFPTRAVRQRVSGRVVLACIASDNGVMRNCTIESETPEGYGFGDAAIRLAREFRVAPATSNGVPTAGGTFRIPISFILRQR